MEFKDPKGKITSLEDICSLVDENYEYVVHVGTDSQVHKKIGKIVYITAIALHKRGKGGTFFLWKEREGYKKAKVRGIPVPIAQRLTNEAWRTLRTCFDLKEILPLNASIKVHLDVSGDAKNKSYSVRNQLEGMFTSQGFEVAIKPDAWAAQHLANRFTK